MESDSQQIANARSSPSGESGEGRSPLLMFRQGWWRSQLCDLCVCEEVGELVYSTGMHTYTQTHNPKCLPYMALSVCS